MKKKIISILICAMTFILPYSKINAVYEPTNFEPHCQAYKVVSLDTGQVMYELNADEKMYPASLTKLMTALVVVNEVEDLNTMVTVQQSSIDKIIGTDSSLGGVKAGEQYSVKDLLYILLMVSGNDVAEVLADFVSGSNEPLFIQKMNDTAAALGMTGTHYVNPHGLHDPEHYTTANDLEKLTLECAKDPVLKEIIHTNKNTYVLPANETHPEMTLVNTNFLLDKNTSHYYKYAKGVKTGHTDAAGRCLISTASKNGYNYMIIVLNAPSEYSDISGMYDYVDTIALYNWLFDTFEYKEVLASTTPVAELPVNLSWGDDYIQLFPKTDIATLVPKEADKSTITYNVKLTSATEDGETEVKSIDAPVKKGDVLGEVEVVYAGQVIGKTELVSATDVDRTAILYVTSGIVPMAQQLWFQLVIILLILMLIIYIFGKKHYAKKKNTSTINYKNYRKK